MATLFTKIINGEIPSYQIYQDERTFAFLDIHPFTPGHVLVVSKAEVDKFQDLDDRDYQAFMATVRKVAQRLDEVLQPQRVCLKVIGFDVPHAHMHVFPCESTQDFLRHPDQSAEPDHAALAQMAERLAF